MEANKMNSNKENVRRSKIPVPVNRTYLALASKHDEADKTFRYPLKTITGQSNLTTDTAGPSKNRIDRHVTRRIQAEHLAVQDQPELPVRFNVFKDNERQATPTPFMMSPPFAVSTVKKVKSSLRRAHTKDLQGSTPVVLARELVEWPEQCTLTKSTAERDKKRDFLKGIYMDVLNQNYTGDTMQYLLSMERKVAREPNIRRVPRSCVINWMIKVDNNRGNPAVVQCACWYLDNYLSTVFVPIYRLQLSAAACYWLATKFHGNVMSNQRLVKCSSHAFSPSKLVTAEMDILTTLQYPVQPVIPHDFIPFLSWWCDAEASGLLESAANFICQSGVMVSKNLCEEYPSVVAAACVQNALILLGRSELLTRFESCPIYKKASQKARDLPATCAHLRVCLRALASFTYEYKSPVLQYSVAPHYVAPRIIKAVNSDEILILEEKLKR